MIFIEGEDQVVGFLLNGAFYSSCLWHFEVANFFHKKLLREARVIWITPLERSDLLKEYSSSLDAGKKARILKGCRVLAVV